MMQWTDLESLFSGADLVAEGVHPVIQGPPQCSKLLVGPASTII